MPSSKPLMAQSSGPIPASVESALRTLETESGGINALATALRGPLGEAFARAVDLIRNAKGRVIVTGLGKSGHMARKIAATLASTGTPAFFVHTAEAAHGDLAARRPRLHRAGIRPFPPGRQAGRDAQIRPRLYAHRCRDSGQA